MPTDTMCPSQTQPSGSNGVAKPDIKLTLVANLSDKNIGQFKKMNSACFPVTYHENFYSKILEYDFTALAYVQDVMVAGVACRIEPPESEGEKPKCCVMTLCVLKPYRRYGIASLLLKWVFDELERRSCGCGQVKLQVQTSNEEALTFYQSHGTFFFNFEFRIKKAKF